MVSIVVDQVQLPEDVERGATVGMQWSTSSIEMDSGHVQTNQNWSQAKLVAEVGYGMMDNDDVDGFQRILNFAKARRGSAYGFLFKDWSDFEAEDELIGVGDAANKDFQLVKTYPDTVRPWTRRITRPVSGTLTVELDGTPTSAFTQPSPGLIRFTDAPGEGVQVTASFEFLVPVRFDVDLITLELEWAHAGVIRSFPLTQVPE